MNFDLKDKHQVNEFFAQAEALRSKGAYVELKTKRKLSSLSQNAYRQMLFAYFAAITGFNEDEVKLDWFKRLVNHDLFVIPKTNLRGKTINTTKSSSELSDKERTLAIDRFKDWSAKQGILLPDSDDEDFLRECKRVIDKNKK